MPSSIPHTHVTPFTFALCLRQTYCLTKAALPASPALAMRPYFSTPRLGQWRVGPALVDSLAATLRRVYVVHRSLPRRMICTASGLLFLRYGRTPCMASLSAHSRQVLTGRPPFFGMTEVTAAYLMLSGARPARPNHHEISDRLWYMVERCWHVVPSERMSAEEAADLLETELRRASDSSA